MLHIFTAYAVNNSAVFEELIDPMMCLLSTQLLWKKILVKRFSV